MAEELYTKERNRFYGQYPEYPTDLGGREYALYQCKALKPQTVEDIRVVTDEIWWVYYVLYNYLQEKEDIELMERLGYPKEVIPYLFNGYPPTSFLARLDLIVNEETDTYKLMENNSDTPFFEVECFEMNGIVAKHFGMNDVNKSQRQDLYKHYMSEIKYIAEQVYDNDLSKVKVVIAGKREYEEETKQMKAIHKALGASIDVEYVPIMSLLLCTEKTELEGVTYERGVYTPNLEAVDVIIRLGHPIDYLMKDHVIVQEEWEQQEQEQHKDFKIGLELIKMHREERVFLLNPPEAFVMQPKSLMAYIWENRANREIFNEEMTLIIEAHFLPTFFDPSYFIERGLPYVKKANIGREGESVEIYTADNQLQQKSLENSYGEEGYVYQAYEELPKLNIMTEQGVKKDMRYIIGSFVVQDKASAFGMRVGSAITEHDSYWLACGTVVEKEEASE